MRTIFKWINILFSIGLIFIALGIAYTIVPYFGNQALIVRSGSMSPAIDAGSIVVVRPDKKFISPIVSTPIYNEGDIISFRSENNPKTIITHRIVGFEAEKTGVFYKTKGDANDSVDSWLVSEQNILGKTYFTLPFVGRILAFTKSNIGFPLLIIFPAVLVIFLEIRAIFKEIQKQKRVLQIQLPSAASLTSLKVLLPIFMLIFVFGSTSAYLNDSETSTKNAFTAAQVFPSATPTITPTPTPTSTPTPTPTPVGIATHVVISEVQIKGDGTSLNDDEFVELYNPTSSPVVMSGWRLRRKNSSGTEENLVLALNGTVPAHGYFLIIDAIGYNGSVTGDVIYSAPSNELTNNYTVLLYSDAGVTLVDKVGFGPSASDPETSAFSSNPSANGSIERKAYSTSDATSMVSGADASKGNGFDSNDNSTDFILRLVSQPQNSSSATEVP